MSLSTETWPSGPLHGNSCGTAINPLAVPREPGIALQTKWPGTAVVTVLVTVDVRLDVTDDETDVVAVVETDDVAEVLLVDVPVVDSELDWVLDCVLV